MLACSAVMTALALWLLSGVALSQRKTTQRTLETLCVAERICGRVGGVRHGTFAWQDRRARTHPQPARGHRHTQLRMVGQLGGARPYSSRSGLPARAVGLRRG